MRKCVLLLIFVVFTMGVANLFPDDTNNPNGNNGMDTVNDGAGGEGTKGRIPRGK